MRELCAGCADGDPNQPVGAGTHLTSRIRGAEDEVTGPERDLFTVDEQGAAAADHRVYLFLVVGCVVVLRCFPTWWKLEPVDFEVAYPKRRAQPTKHAIG